jgi:5'(3')-deoxyribonucleotidase
MKPHVLVDVDGVLCDFIGGVLPLVGSITGRTVKHADVHCFDFCKALGLSPDHARAVKRHISEVPGWWQHLSPLPGAVEGVARLREIGEITIVTSPWNSCRTWLHDRETWLKKHFDIPHADVIATAKKWMVDGDIFVDDRSDTLEKWDAARIARGRPCGAIQWATPHNRAEKWNGHSTNDWGELIRIVDSISALSVQVPDFVFKREAAP